MATKKTESSIPNAAKFVDMLIGKGGNYTFETALADVVDNAIEAGARNIDVIVNFDDESLYVLDDGNGMNDETHREAMKFAAQTRDYSEKDLGKFGTGMKAASLSQAERLTVATRARKSSSISIRCLDREHIKETNDWDQLTLILDESELPPLVLEHLKKSHGTAVLWNRLTSNTTKRGVLEAERQAELYKSTKRAELHISMIFHRFLTGETVDGSSVAIRINGNPIEPYDPFARDEKGTITMDPIHLKVNGSAMNLQGYVLPPKKEWSSPKAHEEHGRPKGWNASQGFYIYRNDRLIQWGSWLRMRTAEPHASLARVALDFTSALDEVLSVTVDKSKVTLPHAVSERLEPAVALLVKKANERYRDKTAGLSGSSLPGRTVVGPPGLKKKLTAAALVESLEKLATIHSKTAELAVLQKLLAEEMPAVAEEIGWRK